MLKAYYDLFCQFYMNSLAPTTTTTATQASTTSTTPATVSGKLK